MTRQQRALLFRDVTKLLRPDVLYVTVSQANNGLEAVKLSHPNVLVINAGGDGNIPIPLIKGKIVRQPIPSNIAFQRHVGFVGHIKGHDLSRVRALQNIRDGINTHNTRSQKVLNTVTKICQNVYYTIPIPLLIIVPFGKR